MTQSVFECPLCRTPFQATPEMAGSTVLCPNCTGAVQLPARSAIAFPIPNIESWECPSCKGQFGYTPEMLGNLVACPHCNSKVSLTSDVSGGPRSITSEIAISLGVPPESHRKRFRGYRPPKQSPPNTGLPTPAIKSAEENSADGSAANTPPLPTAIKQALAQPYPLPGRNEKTLSGPDPSIETRVFDPAKLGEPNPVEHDPDEITVVQNSADTAQQPREPDLTQLLPPKFFSSNPAIIRLRSGKDEDRFVLLPDGAGGYVRVSNALVRVELGDESAMVVAPNRTRSIRRRLIVNLVAALICAAILYAAFRWLMP